MKHVISVLLENEPGALSRVVGLFSARGYNIETLTVAPTEDATLSRMTIVTTGSDEIIEQITKHLNRLVDVVKVVDLTEGAHIERELLLIKLKVPANQLAALRKAIDEAKARVLVEDPNSFTIELTASEARVSKFIATVSNFGEVLETVRSGALAVYSGGETLKTINVKQEA